MDLSAVLYKPSNFVPERKWSVILKFLSYSSAFASIESPVTLSSGKFYGGEFVVVANWWDTHLWCNTSADEKNPGIFPVYESDGITATYQQKKTKKKICNHKKCIQRFEEEDWKVCFQLQAEESSVNKDHGVTMQTLFETMSQKGMYNLKTIESGFTRWRKVWIVVSNF